MPWSWSSWSWLEDRPGFWPRRRPPRPSRNANVEARPDLAHRVADEGHAVANHTWTHPPLTSLSDDGIRSELNRAQSALQQQLDLTPTCFRPPYGDTDARVFTIQSELGLGNEAWTVKPGAYQSHISRHIGTWDVDTNDWKRRTATVRSALASVEAGDVVLFHDIHPTALGPLADWLAANHTRFRLDPLPGCGGRPHDPNEGREPIDYYQFQIARLYLAYFNRLPDTNGWDHWNTHYLSGMSLEAISDRFVVSPEFVNRYGHLDAAEFVHLVYHNVLGRRPDPTGETQWLLRLAAGLSRGDLMLRFSESPEFKNRTAERLGLA